MMGPQASRHGTGLYRQYLLERVVHGVAFDQALAEELQVQGIRRAFVLAAPNAQGSAHLERLQRALGDRLAGVCTQIAPHVPMPAVLAAARQAQALQADHLVAFGGSSVVDAAKAVAYVLGSGDATPQGLATMHEPARLDPSRRPADSAHWLRISALPMTLSAAEHTYFAGVTDPERRVKNLIAHPLMVPQTVVYDPELTLPIDVATFLASGIKAIDHAAERLASKASHPMSDATAIQALGMLARALPAVAQAPTDLAARLDCQLGAWLSITGANAGVRVGASHALGHVLGAHCGVPHGLTSCVLLPAVMRWNSPANATEQARVSAALGAPGSAAGEAIAALVAQLGLPLRLRDVGVAEHDLEAVAAKSLHDPTVRNNPRPVRGVQDALEILRLAW